MELVEAWTIASELMSELAPYCDRIAIAGSIRRKKPEVKDIELVAIPTLPTNLFGNVVDVGRTALDCKLDDLGFPRTRDGQRYKQLMHPAGIKVDLFLVRPPAQWGVIHMIRTGPAEFSQWIVTRRRLGGALPDYMRVRNGGVYIGETLNPTPREEDFFFLLGIPLTEPENRLPLWPMRPPQIPDLDMSLRMTFPISKKDIEPLFEECE